MKPVQVLPALLLVTWLVGHPAAAGAETTWLCGLAGDAVHLVCVADLDPVDETVSAPPVVATVNGTRFPLDPSRQWTVDLWSPPTDLEQVRLLARATICYRSPGCSVILADAPRAR